MHQQEPQQQKQQQQGPKQKRLQGLAPQQPPAQQRLTIGRTSPTTYKTGGLGPATAAGLLLQQQIISWQQQAAQLQHGAALQQNMQPLRAPSPKQRGALRLPPAATQQAAAALGAPAPAPAPAAAAAAVDDSGPPAKRHKAAQPSTAHQSPSQAHAAAQDSSAGSEHFTAAHCQPAATAVAAAAAAGAGGVDSIGPAATTSSSRKPRAASLKAKALISEDAQLQRVKPEWLTDEAFYSPGTSPTQASTAGPPAAAVGEPAAAAAAVAAATDNGVPSAAAAIATAAKFAAVAKEVLDVAGRALAAVGHNSPPQQQQQHQQPPQQQQNQQHDVFYDLQQQGQQEEQQWDGYVYPQDYQEQQQQQQDFDLVKQELDYAAAQQQQQQQQLPADLNDQYKVWPDLDPSPDGSTDFDLIPASLCSPGVQPMMDLLITSTQRKGTKSEPAANGRAQQGKGRGRQSAGGARAARGSKGSRGMGHAANTMTAAAATLLAAYPGAAGPGYSGSCPDSGRYTSRDDERQYSQQQYSQQSDQQYSQDAFEDQAAAYQDDCAAAAADDEEAWYEAAAAAGSAFSWHNAPCGRLYRVIYKKSGVNTLAALVPDKVVTRQSFQDELWHMSKRTRVVPVTDPCHPCMHNAVRPATMPPSQHLKLEANKDLAADNLLGIYHGNMVTMQEDQQKNCADPTCSYGLQHAYNMTATSVTDSKLECPVDHTPLEIMVVGDSKHCRLCLINDVAYWGQEMEQQGWGPCPQAAKGTCNCKDYKVDTDESKEASINVIWKHYMYRALNGDYIPAIAAYTSKPVAEGRELLTTYEQDNDGFWDAIRMNLGQYCYVQTLAKKSQGPVDALEKILSLIGDQPNSSSGSSDAVLQQIQQLAAAGLESAQHEEQNLSVLLQEARAMQLKQRVPAEVAEARRRTVAAHMQQTQQED